MWNQLKQWLTESGRRPYPRRHVAAHFRGQFESLETRSMLSASYADAAPTPVEFHVVAIIVTREPQPPFTAVYSGSAVALYDNAPWENHFAPRPDFGPKGPIGFNGGGPPPHFDPNRQPATSSGPPAQYNAPDASVVDSAVPKGAIGASAPTIDATTGGVQNETQTRVVVDIGKPRSELPPRLINPFANYYSSLSTAESTGSSTTLPVVRSASAIEAVFDSYSSDSLLLASDAKKIDDDRLDRDLDDDSFAENVDGSDTRHARQSLIDETTDAALNALERERRAIDAVLSELHEVKLSTDDEAPASSKTTEQRNIHQDRHAERGSDWNVDAAATARDASVADGGMVMLEPSGDANSGAYDLTSAYLSELQIADTRPLGVEASLGMYQAIDIGTKESRPADRQALPIAQPATSIRPSVSAENAPAKKSEQPT